MNLVVITTMAPDILELFHYIGKKFEGSVAMDITQYPDTDGIKVVIEDFRVRGLDIVA